jgi:hypothetical protein
MYKPPLDTVSEGGGRLRESGRALIADFACPKLRAQNCFIWCGRLDLTAVGILTINNGLCCRHMTLIHGSHTVSSILQTTDTIRGVISYNNTFMSIRQFNMTFFLAIKPFPNACYQQITLFLMMCVQLLYILLHVIKCISVTIGRIVCERKNDLLWQYGLCVTVNAVDRSRILAGEL